MSLEFQHFRHLTLKVDSTVVVAIICNFSNIMSRYKWTPKCLLICETWDINNLMSSKEIQPNNCQHRNWSNLPRPRNPHQPRISQTLFHELAIWFSWLLCPCCSIFPLQSLIEEEFFHCTYKMPLQSYGLSHVKLRTKGHEFQIELWSRIYWIKIQVEYREFNMHFMKKLFEDLQCERIPRPLPPFLRHLEYWSDVRRYLNSSNFMIYMMKFMNQVCFDMIIIGWLEEDNNETHERQ